MALFVIQEEYSTCTIVIQGKRLNSSMSLRPANSDKIFIDIIVMAPVIQIIAMVLGFIILALELPAPFFKGTSIHRSWVVRIVLLAVQAFFTILFYQV